MKLLFFCLLLVGAICLTTPKNLAPLEQLQNLRDPDAGRCSTNLVGRSQVSSGSNRHIIPANSTIQAGFSFNFTGAGVNAQLQFCRLQVTVPLICNLGAKTQLTNFTFPIGNQIYLASSDGSLVPTGIVYQSEIFVLPVDKLCPGMISYYDSEIFAFLLGVVSSGANGAGVNSVVTGGTNNLKAELQPINDINAKVTRDINANVGGVFRAILIRPNLDTVLANGSLEGNSYGPECGCFGNVTTVPSVTTVPVTTAPSTSCTSTITPTTFPHDCPRTSNLNVSTSLSNQTFADSTLVTLIFAFSGSAQPQRYSILDLQLILGVICGDNFIDLFQDVPDHIFAPAISGNFTFSFNLVTGCASSTVVSVAVNRGYLGTTKPNLLTSATIVIILPNVTTTAPAINFVSTSVSSVSSNQTQLLHSYSYNCSAGIIPSVTTTPSTTVCFTVPPVTSICANNSFNVLTTFPPPVDNSTLIPFDVLFFPFRFNFTNFGAMQNYYVYPQYTRIFFYCNGDGPDGPEGITNFTINATRIFTFTDVATGALISSDSSITGGSGAIVFNNVTAFCQLPSSGIYLVSIATYYASFDSDVTGTAFNVSDTVAFVGTGGNKFFAQSSSNFISSRTNSAHCGSGSVPRLAHEQVKVAKAPEGPKSNTIKLATNFDTGSITIIACCCVVAIVAVTIKLVREISRKYDVITVQQA